MFYLDSENIFRVRELDAFPWLVHGFGTRLADVPAHVSPLATVKQIHSAECVAADGREGVLGEADALIERTAGHAVAVKTADCIPVLLADERMRVVAAVHAGWRGTVQSIVQHAIAKMQEAYGSEPADLHAAIGPGIGSCCYEVGPEVAVQFGRTGSASLDLPAENRAQLESAGVSASRIYVAGLCTRCDAALFHSFRRDREASGRMYSFIGVR